jgi:hypothetical protein
MPIQPLFMELTIEPARQKSLAVVKVRAAFLQLLSTTELAWQLESARHLGTAES